MSDRLLRNMGAELTGRGPGTLEYQMPLAPPGYSLDWWFDPVDDATVLTWP
jgi:hypothetical protein